MASIIAKVLPMHVVHTLYVNVFPLSVSCGRLFVKDHGILHCNRSTEIVYTSIGGLLVCIILLLRSAKYGITI